MNLRCFQSIFFGKIKESTGKLNFIYFPCNQVAIAKNSASNFKSIDVFFHDNFIVILKRLDNRRLQFHRFFHFCHTVRRTCFYWFDVHRIASFQCKINCHLPVISLRQHHCFRYTDTSCLCHQMRTVFVHTQSRCQNTTSCQRNSRHGNQTLNGSILTIFSMHDRKRHIDRHCFCTVFSKKHQTMCISIR